MLSLEPVECEVRGAERTLQAETQVGERAGQTAQREEEGQRLVNLDRLRQMSLESLLYYVLAGDGRRVQAEGNL